MSHQLTNALTGLERAVTKMGELVQAQLDSALAALARRDATLADEVVRNDDELDRLDVSVEIDGLRVLHVHQLYENEFRLVVAIVKIDTQLERIGDLAVNLAERAIALSGQPPLPRSQDFELMASRAQEMVRRALTAFVERDAAEARAVLELDRPVDALHRKLFTVYEELMRREPETIERAVQMLSCSRHLERIGDHAKNIAEDVVFAVDGEIIRHQHHQPLLPRTTPEAAPLAAGERA